jgi:hypothetical protein
MYKKNRYINVRMYAATYLFNTHTNSTGTYAGTLNLIGHSSNDYGYDEFFFNRSAQDGFWSRQLKMDTGGFKTGIESSHGIGQSNKYVASLNIRFDMPIKVFIKPYIDIGIYGYLPTISDGYSNKFIYSGGFVFEILKDYFEFYLPIINSKEIKNTYDEIDGSFLKRISFIARYDLGEIGGH